MIRRLAWSSVSNVGFDLRCVLTHRSATGEDLHPVGRLLRHTHIHPYTHTHPCVRHRHHTARRTDLRPRRMDRRRLRSAGSAEHHRRHRGESAGVRVLHNDLRRGGRLSPIRRDRACEAASSRCRDQSE